MRPVDLRQRGVPRQQPRGVGVVAPVSETPENLPKWSLGESPDDDKEAA